MADYICPDGEPCTLPPAACNKPQPFVVFNNLSNTAWLDLFTNHGNLMYPFNNGLMGTQHWDEVTIGTGDEAYTDFIENPNDYVAMGRGGDVAYGEEGCDIIFGGFGISCEVQSLMGALAPVYPAGFILQDDTRADTLYGGVGNDSLFGEQGGDRLYGGDDCDLVSGGQGNDKLYGENDNDSLCGGSGNDVVVGGQGDDLMSGGTGNDKLYGDDEVVGSAGGEDAMYGDCGNDIMYGGNEDGVWKPGCDTCASDTCPAGEDGDTMFGGSGNDKMYGEAGDDVMVGGNGNDTMDGGADDDIMVGDGADNNKPSCECCDPCTDPVSPNCDSMLGGDGDDCMYGLAGGDTMRGGADDDTIIGGAGDDRLFGNDGDDIIEGGEGNDAINGGAGADKILYGATDDRDTVTLFTRDDVLCLQGITDQDGDGDADLDDLDFDDDGNAAPLVTVWENNGSTYIGFGLGLDDEVFSADNYIKLVGVKGADGVGACEHAYTSIDDLICDGYKVAVNCEFDCCELNENPPISQDPWDCGCVPA